MQRGRAKLLVDRTFATTRSVEFNAVIVAGGTAPSADIKLVLLLHEALRHCKPIGSWGTGVETLRDAGIEIDGPGILQSDLVVKSYTEDIVAALGRHRVWDRADSVVASKVPPAR